MEGDAPVLMATTSLSGIVNLIYEVHAGSLAATISPTLGAAGRAGFMAGTHGTRPCAAVPHGSGARVWGIMVAAFPGIAQAAEIAAASSVIAFERGLPPNTGSELIDVCVFVSTTAIRLERETLI